MDKEVSLADHKDSFDMFFGFNSVDASKLPICQRTLTTLLLFPKSLNHFKFEAPRQNTPAGGSLRGP